MGSIICGSGNDSYFILLNYFRVSFFSLMLGVFFGGGVGGVKMSKKEEHSQKACECYLSETARCAFFFFLMGQKTDMEP